MSYYILPKTTNTIFINPLTSSRKSKPILSITLHNYYQENKTIIDDLCLNDIVLSSNTFTDIIRITNPYEFIYSKVPGSRFPVSKLKSSSNVLYDLIEIMNTLNLQDVFKSQEMIFLHIGKNSQDSQYSINLLRDIHNDDENFIFDEINTEMKTIINDKKFDYIFCDFETDIYDNLNLYVLQLIKFLMIVLNNQAADGSCIIKINTNFHKPINDIMYILSSMYDKVYIIKPITSNVMTFEKYIVCKKLLTDDKIQQHYRTNYCNLLQFLSCFTRNKNFISLIDDDIPSYFVNKLSDSNIIVGQQQLEAQDQIINILKSYNRYEKIELIQKNNIQKSVIWCEKYRIPCNKFSDKINIFLPLENETPFK
jgi:hypothetical protein